MIRGLLALAATSAVVSATGDCVTKGNDLLACIKGLDYSAFNTDPFDDEVDTCCDKSATYASECGGVYGHLNWWRSQASNMNDQEYYTGLYVLHECPRAPLDECADKLNMIATCIMNVDSTTPVDSDADYSECCSVGGNWGDCDAHDDDDLWAHVVNAGLDRVDLEQKVDFVTEDFCPQFSDMDCENAVYNLKDLLNVEGVSPDDEFKADESKRCTAGYAVTWMCSFHDAWVDSLKLTWTDDEKDIFDKQTAACDVRADDGDDGDDGGDECDVSEIPGVWLYEEHGIKYLASEICPPTTPGTGSMCDPVGPWDPAMHRYAFYKIGHFNEASMMVIPEHCRPLMPLP